MAALAERFSPARLGRSYRWLLASSWSSNLGDGIALAAGPLLVASLTTEPFLVSLAAALTWAPTLALTLWAGVLADRHDRRRMLMWANALRVVVLVALVAGLAGGAVTIVTALAAIALLASAEVFADGAATTLPPMLVHRDDLALANARLFTGFITFNQLAGPPLGAALFAAALAWPFAVQAVLVAAAALLVRPVVLPWHGRDRDAAPSNVRREVIEGFGWTARHAAVRTLALTILIFNVTFGAAWSVLVLYATQRLGMGSIGFGVLTTISAVGGLVGTTLYGRITRRISLGTIMRIGLIIETLTHLALAVTTTSWVAGAVFFVFGAHAFIWGTTSVTVRQRAVPGPLQGRVGSVYMLAVHGGLVLGSVLGGVLASRHGVTAPFWFAFAGSAVFLAALWPQLRHVAHDEPGPDPG